MKLMLRPIALLLAIMVFAGPQMALAGGPVAAAPVGRATADFDNARFEREETAWGRLVADALRARAKTDIALVNAGSLQNGKLSAGPIGQADVDALLKFGEDDVVTLRITGAQLKSALERAVEVYPTNSTAFLHGSGFTAQFDAGAKAKQRVVSLRVRGKEVGEADTFTLALPHSLAQGAGGFYNIFNAQDATSSGSSLGKTLLDHIRARGEITPDNTPRFAPQS